MNREKYLFCFKKRTLLITINKGVRIGSLAAGKKPKLILLAKSQGEKLVFVLIVLMKVKKKTNKKSNWVLSSIVRGN